MTDIITLFARDPLKYENSAEDIATIIKKLREARVTAAAPKPAPAAKLTKAESSSTVAGVSIDLGDLL